MTRVEIQLLHDELEDPGEVLRHVESDFAPAPSSGTVAVAVANGQLATVVSWPPAAKPESASTGGLGPSSGSGADMRRSASHDDDALFQIYGDADIRRQYGGQYVGIRDGRVVISGSEAAVFKATIDDPKLTVVRIPSDDDIVS